MRIKYRFDFPRKCPNCGKNAKKKTSDYRGFVPYEGNEQILKDYSKPNYDGEMYYQHTLWDGETYIQQYGHFCSLNCTSQYANRHIALKEGWT